MVNYCIIPLLKPNVQTAHEFACQSTRGLVLLEALTLMTCLVVLEAVTLMIKLMSRVGISTQGLQPASHSQRCEIGQHLTECETGGQGC
jgi:hypothetical protein